MYTPAEMNSVCIQCMEMVRCGTTPWAQLAFDWTCPDEFAAVALVWFRTDLISGQILKYIE